MQPSEFPFSFLISTIFSSIIHRIRKKNWGRKNIEINKATHLKRAPGKIEKASDPKERIVRNHNIGPAAIAELLQILLRVKRQIHHEDNRWHNQNGVEPEFMAIRAWWWAGGEARTLTVDWWGGRARDWREVGRGVISHLEIRHHSFGTS